MKVEQVYSKDVCSVEPTGSIALAAKLMVHSDIGALPVIKNGRIVGIVTDRDLVSRGLAAGMSPHAPLWRVMTVDVMSCSPGDELDDALAVMSTERIRRLPVCTNSGELVGMLALADVARISSRARDFAEALSEICSTSDVPCRVPMFT